MKRFALVVAVTGCVAFAAPLRAQAAGDSIPREYRPPAGMCRIWLDGVPPSRQPEPTDCPTAVRRRPPNARVIFGPEPARPKPADVEEPKPKKGEETLPVKRLKPERRKPDSDPGTDLRRVLLPKGMRPPE